jgi:hypothetical protein
MLEYGGVFRTNEVEREVSGGRRVESTYSLRVKMTKGEGKAEDSV